jgi:threonyl-tRNA synthetase
MQKKIRTAQMEKIPYMLVVGDTEQAESTVSVRTRAGVNLGAMSISVLIDRLREEVATRKDKSAPEVAS